MTKSTTRAPAGRLALVTWVVLLIAGLVVLGFQFVSANAAAADATADMTRSVSWVGIPMFEVFSREGRQGAEFAWGTPAVLGVVPLVVALAVGLLARSRARDSVRTPA